MKQRVWPVYGFGDSFQREAVATFMTWGDAADYSMRPVDRGGWEPRNLYIGESQQREGGSFHGNL